MNKILVFVIDDSLGMGGGVWWGRVVVQNLPSERKLPMGKVQKKSKKKLTSVSFMYVCVAENAELLVFLLFFAPSP